jgi:hypothetical protein
MAEIFSLERLAQLFSVRLKSQARLTRLLTRTAVAPEVYVTYQTRKSIEVIPVREIFLPALCMPFKY